MHIITHKYDQMCIKITNKNLYPRWIEYSTTLSYRGSEVALTLTMIYKTLQHPTQDRPAQEFSVTDHFAVHCSSTKIHYQHPLGHVTLLTSLRIT